MTIFLKFSQIHYYDLCRNRISIMIQFPFEDLVKIERTSDSDRHSVFPSCEMNFRKFSRNFLRCHIYRDESYLWSNEELRIEVY